MPVRDIDCYPTHIIPSRRRPSKTVLQHWGWSKGSTSTSIRPSQQRQHLIYLQPASRVQRPDRCATCTHTCVHVVSSQTSNVSHRPPSEISFSLMSYHAGRQFACLACHAERATKPAGARRGWSSARHSGCVNRTRQVFDRSSDPKFEPTT